MSGLIEKDLAILKQRKQFFILMFFISVMLAFTSGADFVVGYVTILMAIFSISTLNYDEFDNSYAFLMTLPITEKVYVIEKYVLAFALGSCAWVVGCLIAAFTSVIQHTPFELQSFLGYLAFVPLGVIFVAINLPIQLKYGQEKSRMVLLAIAGIVAIATFFVTKVASSINIPTAQIIAQFENASGFAIAACVILFTLVVVLISYVISVAVMKQKQY